MSEGRLWREALEVPDHHQVPVVIGPLRLAIGYRPGEWLVSWTRDDFSGPESRVSVGEVGSITDASSESTVHRFLTRRTDGSIRLRPALADRPVIARPELPLRVPAGDEATIYVSTPLWVCLELTEPERRLLEIPVNRPSDTWFGPDTRRGVVAYASHTAARLDLDNLPPQAHCVISRVTVRNETDTVLPLDRLGVPAPNLNLFVDREGGLWTSPLLAIRDSGSAPARVELSTTAPEEAPDAELIAGPREVTQRSVFSRALHVLVAETGR